jgi:hypothetical protein
MRGGRGLDLDFLVGVACHKIVARHAL